MTGKLNQTAGAAPLWGAAVGCIAKMRPTLVPQLVPTPGPAKQIHSTDHRARFTAHSVQLTLGASALSATPADSGSWSEFTRLPTLHRSASQRIRKKVITGADDEPAALVVTHSIAEDACFLPFTTEPVQIGKNEQARHPSYELGPFSALCS